MIYIDLFKTLNFFNHYSKKKSIDAIYLSENKAAVMYSIYK